jgi:hypothetical protein
MSEAQLRAIDDALARDGPEHQKKVSTTPRKRSVGKRKTKLTIEEAEEIRMKYARYVYGTLRLSLEYGVSRTTIIKIVRNQIFKKTKPKRQ